MPCTSTLKEHLFVKRKGLRCLSGLMLLWIAHHGNVRRAHLTMVKFINYMLHKLPLANLVQTMGAT